MRKLAIETELSRVGEKLEIVDVVNQKVENGNGSKIGL
jgi:hypothetical protein